MEISKRHGNLSKERERECVRRETVIGLKFTLNNSSNMSGVNKCLSG